MNLAAPLSAGIDEAPTRLQYSDVWHIGDDRKGWLYSRVLPDPVEGWNAIAKAIVEKTGPLLDAIGSPRKVLLHSPGGLEGSQIYFEQLARAQREFGQPFVTAFLRALETISLGGFVIDLYMGYPHPINGESVEEYAKRSGIYRVDPKHRIWIDTGATLQPGSFGDRLAMLLRREGFTVGGEGCPGIEFLVGRGPTVNEATAKHQGQWPVMCADDDPHNPYVKQEYIQGGFTLLQHRAQSATERLEQAVSLHRVRPDAEIASPLFLDWAAGPRGPHPFIDRWKAAR